MHLRPTAGCEISILIWHIFYGILIETPLHNISSNIKIDIWHPAVGLRCIIPPRHLSQLKTRAIPCYLVEIPQWERRGDRKHPWSTIQHIEQLRSHPKGNHPLSILWRHFRSRLDIFAWDSYRDPLHNISSNIKIDIWHPAVGLRCIIPPNIRLSNINFDIWKQIVLGVLYK
jgi:hypothetical protein